MQLIVIERLSVREEVFNPPEDGQACKDCFYQQKFFFFRDNCFFKKGSFTRPWESAERVKVSLVYHIPTEKSGRCIEVWVLQNPNPKPFDGDKQSRCQTHPGGGFSVLGGRRVLCWFLSAEGRRVEALGREREVELASLALRVGSVFTSF